MHNIGSQSQKPRGQDLEVKSQGHGAAIVKKRKEEQKDTPIISLQNLPSGSLISDSQYTKMIKDLASCALKP